MSEVERKDETVSAAVHERRRRSDAGEVRGTARDVELLPWVVEMDGMPVDLLARIAGTSQGAVRNLLARWRRAGWVESGRVDAGPAWCWATKEGIARFGAAEYVARPPSTARAAHTRAVIEARMLLQETRPDWSWRSERNLRAGYGVGVPGHVPDAEIGFVQQSGDVVPSALEVEITRKPLARVDSIMAGLIGQYQFVFYLVSREVRPVVERARAMRPAERQGDVFIEDLVVRDE